MRFFEISRGHWILRKPQVAPCLGSYGEEPEQVGESNILTMRNPKEPIGIKYNNTIIPQMLKWKGKNIIKIN